MERELGIRDNSDSSKPLLLKLLEQVKYGPVSDEVAYPKSSGMESFKGWSSNVEPQPL